MQVGYAKIAILGLYLALMPAVNAATSPMLSTQSPVDHGHRPASWVWHIAGSKRRCWLREKTTKCLWQEANRTAHLTARSDKSVVYVTNNKRLYSTFCTVQANYWQTDTKHRAASLRQQSYLLEVLIDPENVCSARNDSQRNSKSLAIAPFNWSHMSSYLHFAVTMALSCIVSEIKRDIG